MIRTLLAVVFVLAITSALAPVVEADQRGGADQGGGFSVRDVDGPTAFAFDGFATVGAAMAPAAAVGRFVADGAGRLNDGVRTLVVGGTTFHQTFECTYSVNHNGTGSAVCDVMTGPVASHESFDFVIVERKKEAFFTATTPGVTVRGATRLQK
jgi:hypothetical protein